MGKIPEDPYERRAWLAQWGAEQRERLGDRGPLHARLRLRIGTMIEWQVERLLNPVFDRGLNTSRNLYFPSPDGGGVIYVAGPSPWHILPRALRRVGASDHDVFADFGCGKGRVVHQAARRPLKKVIGVEINPEVAGLAQSLVVAQRRKYRCRSVEIVTCDAARFRVPDDLTIAYIANPFRGKTMDAMMGNLIESIDSRPRRVRLIYHRPTYGAGVLATGRFRLLPDISFGATAIFESRG